MNEGRVGCLLISRNSGQTSEGQPGFNAPPDLALFFSANTGRLIS
jgi:hypothetical protein